MDIKSQKERSLNMSRIRSRDTQAEIYFRKLLYHKGIRYRKNLSTLPGKPDLFIHRFQTVVFVHGCFWHRHQGCKYAYTPSSRQEFWMKKFEDNVRRDRQTVEILKGQGYRIITVWECTLKRMKKDPLFEEEIINQVTDFLKNSSEQWIEY